MQRSDSPPPPCSHTASFAWPDQLAISCALENHSTLWGDKMVLRFRAFHQVPQVACLILHMCSPFPQRRKMAAHR